MSTVITNAYRLPRSTDLFELKQALTPVKDALHAYVMQAALKEAVYMCDSRIMRDEEFRFGRELRASLEEDRTYGPQKQLTNSNAVVFEHPTTKKRYIGFFGGFGHYELEIAATAGLGEEYQYWNNTDRPENMSERAWKRRKQTWDEIVGHRSVQKSGITMHFFDDFDASLPIMQQLCHTGAVKMPTLDQRCNRAGLNLFMTDRFKEVGKSEYTSQAMRLTREWADGEIDKDIRDGYIATAHLQLLGADPYTQLLSH